MNWEKFKFYYSVAQKKIGLLGLILFICVILFGLYHIFINSYENIIVSHILFVVFILYFALIGSVYFFIIFIDTGGV